MKLQIQKLIVLLLTTVPAAVVCAQTTAQIGKRVFEFRPTKVSPSHVSFALIRQPIKQAMTFKPAVKPTFGFTADFRYSAEIPIAAGTDLYGTGETAGPLRRNGRVTECWNTDQFNYSEKDQSLYQSHPWVLAVRKDGTSFGVLADTTYRCRIDLRKNIRFEAEGPPFPIILIEGNSPQEVVKQLADLTGHMQLPPAWALGYHQCRWSYMSAQEALDVADQFRQKHIPCDTIWFDIDYMNGFRIFTFDPKTFPNPMVLNQRLLSKGFHNVWMIDPGVKIDPNYSVYKSGKEQDVFVKTRSGVDQAGDVWPGHCVFPDFTRYETRSWWSHLYKPFAAKGITGVWNDMNEPSVFKVDSKTMPEESVHRGGGGIRAGSHAQYHNIYGSLMARATSEGMKDANPNKRPFVLTRAGYIGYQRYAATWTGDNTSTWTDLQNAIPMVLNLGLSGQPFSGPDIPGFSKDGPDDPKERKEFFSRWWGLGSMLPFSRGHSSKETVRKEPWAFGPEVEESARQALWRRYVLMPYIYTAFRTSATEGLPVARPLFFADPKDLKLRAEDEGFLLGGDIAVAAKVQDGHKKVDLPSGWPDFPIDGTNANLPELKIRPGAVVPLGPPQEFIGQHKAESLWLVVSLDKRGAAMGQLYEDDGDGYGYQRGDYLLTTYKAQLKGNWLKVWISGTKGKRARPNRQLIIGVIQDGKWRADGASVPDGQTTTLIMPPKPSTGLIPKIVGPVYRPDFSIVP